MVMAIVMVVVAVMVSMMVLLLRTSPGATTYFPLGLLRTSPVAPTYFHWGSYVLPLGLLRTSPGAPTYFPGGSYVLPLGLLRTSPGAPTYFPLGLLRWVLVLRRALGSRLRPAPSSPPSSSPFLPSLLFALLVAQGGVWPGRPGRPVSGMVVPGWNHVFSSSSSSSSTRGGAQGPI